MNELSPVGKSHADCSPSSSYIWMNCPASITKARGRQRRSTIYTREGTAAHVLAEEALRGADTAPVSIDIEGENIVVTEEMLDAVTVYTDIIQEAGQYGSLHIEQRVSVDVGGEPLWGTSDAYVVNEVVGHLDVYDLKYGSGVPVAADSSQLKIYGLGVLEAVEPFYEIATVGLNIVQPRMKDPIRKVVIHANELRAWKQDALLPAIKRIETGDTTETPGEHCRWCVRAGECQALAADAMEKAKVAFGDSPPAVSILSNDELAAILDHADVIVDWVGKVRGEASDRLDKGHTIPGWKLVPKRAQRRWVPETMHKVITDLVEIGVPVLDIVRVETITTVEKVLKRMRIKQPLDAYTFKESSGTTLARENDAREGVDNSARNVFIGLE